MTLSEKILSGIAIALSVWFIKNLVSYYLQKSRLHRSYIIDINYHLLGIKEAKDFLDKLTDKLVKEGSIIKYCPSFVRDEYDLYKSSHTLMFKYFNRDSIEKITKFYKAFWELEIIIEGYIDDLRLFKKEERSLDEEDVKYLKRKKERIESLAELLTQDRIARLSDLPSDYRKRKGAEHILPQ